MAKKSFGINTLIQSTTPNNNKDISKDTTKEPGKTVGLFINVPTSLKKKLDIHCAEQGIKKQDFLIQAIETFLKK